MVIRIVLQLEVNLLVRIDEPHLAVCNADLIIGGGSVMLQAMAYGGTVGDELYDGVRLAPSLQLLNK